VSSRKKICWTGRKYVKGGEEKCEIKVEIIERKKNMMYQLKIMKHRRKMRGTGEKY
jgi:hypothetical protein